MRSVDGKLCGAGKGAKCCAFLVFGGDGFECGRDDEGIKSTMISRVLIYENTNAKRLPVVDYPACQSEDATDFVPGRLGQSA